MLAGVVIGTLLGATCVGAYALYLLRICSGKGRAL
jgi:hypothetical protein